MEAKVSEILENILGMLGLEGSFEVNEGPEEVKVTIEASDPGRLIGFGGETLDALQLIVNQIVGKQASDKEPYKRVSIDVAGWRQNKEADLERRARNWMNEVLESQEDMELEPMPSWQRRVVHMIASETEGVESESIGEGRDRHLIIKAVKAEKSATKKEELE
ncbi:MAG: KH domain-containing protein [Candidatus Daviesbacteria bacterium]|nr:KH domain-containing protein [Candidatus Daviesbacteria bacterium]